MQKLFIAGRLGQKPETRMTPSGQKVTNFNVAVNVRKGGQEETCWWRVAVWGDQFDRMIQYLDKGSAIMVEGDMLPPRTWVDNNSQTRVGLEMTARNLYFSPFGKGSEEQQQEQSSAGGWQQPAAPATQQEPAFAAPTQGQGESTPMDDDLPF